MSNVKVKLNSKGVQDLLKSQEIQDVLQDRADEIVERVGGKGYGTSTKVGKRRANVSIYTKNWKTMSDNKKNNTLLKALRG